MLISCNYGRSLMCATMCVCVRMVALCCCAENALFNMHNFAIISSVILRELSCGGFLGGNCCCCSCWCLSSHQSCRWWMRICQRLIECIHEQLNKRFPYASRAARTKVLLRHYCWIALEFWFLLLEFGCIFIIIILGPLCVSVCARAHGTDMPVYNYFHYGQYFYVLHHTCNERKSLCGHVLRATLRAAQNVPKEQNGQRNRAAC